MAEVHLIEVDLREVGVREAEGEVPSWDSAFDTTLTPCFPTAPCGKRLGPKMVTPRVVTPRVVQLAQVV